ncbi:hypothetical protein Syn6312_2852 [Synechococcus sp. PCC 6312]|nr:hypothetical protein Syn6312_2852 [Synechococcus sp. PCC 6312]
MSANASYQRAEEDIEVLTGITVSHSTLQRLVQRQAWPEVVLTRPIEEMSLDGGMIRLRTEAGTPCEWRDYKALAIHDQAGVAFFKDNEGLIHWANRQPRTTPFTGLGDGHNGVWNILTQIGTTRERIEILDWFHLMENAHKVQATPTQLKAVRDHLWQGQVTLAIQVLQNYRCLGASTFIQYLRHHQHRIIHYQAWQAAGHSIGSGQVESFVKQISLRVKLPGAQWLPQNVPKLLKHRCAYLNGAFAP